MPAYNILNSQVARWKDDFKIDGIDLDLEEGAGSRKEAGPNMVHFVRFKKSKQVIIPGVNSHISLL